MNINAMACCALGEIEGLSDFDTPKEAMLAFCSYSIVKNRYARFGDPAYYNNADNITIFTGVEKYTGSLPTYRNGEEIPYTYDSYGDRNEWGIKVGYASEFAQFIKDNNLGQVIDGPIVENAPKHPGHFVQMFTWVPNKDALIEWYQINYRG